MSKWFDDALLQRKKIAPGRLDTNMTSAYNVQWPVEAGIREQLQNLFDGIAVAYGQPGSPLPMSRIECRKVTSRTRTVRGGGKGRGGWDVFVGSECVGAIFATASAIVVHQENCVLSLRNLKLSSDKVNAGLAGGFGEGFKVGTLVLTRNNWKVSYAMYEERWEFKLIASLDRTLDFVVDGIETDDRERAMTIVNDAPSLPDIERIMSQIPKLFLIIGGIGSSVSIRGDDGNFVLISEDLAGSIYVKGIYVLSSPDLKALSIAVDLHDVAYSNRDRNAISDQSHREMTTIAAALGGPDGRTLATHFLAKSIECKEAAECIRDKHATQAIEAAMGPKAYLHSTHLKAGHVEILERLGYTCVPSGHLRSSRDFKDIMDELMDAQIIEYESDLMQYTRLVNDSCAKINCVQPAYLRVWRPPANLDSVYREISVRDFAFYIPVTILSMDTTEYMFGVLMPAISKHYNSGSFNVFKLIKYFACNPSAGVIDDLAEFQVKSAEDILSNSTQFQKENVKLEAITAHDGAPPTANSPTANSPTANSPIANDGDLSIANDTSTVQTLNSSIMYEGPVFPITHNEKTDILRNRLLRNRDTDALQWRMAKMGAVFALPDIMIMSLDDVPMHDFDLYMIFCALLSKSPIECFEHFLEVHVSRDAVDSRREP